MVAKHATYADDLIRGNKMTFDPEQNRIQIGLLTDEERAALGAAKHGWLCYRNDCWVNFQDPRICTTGDILRAKPAPAQTILVNGIEVPEPVREALRNFDKYWLVFPVGAELSMEVTWYDEAIHHTRLNRGLIHLTEAAAVAHAKAMLAPSMRGDV